MDCRIFRKRLYDLIEDNIAYDLKDAMLEHIAECEVCRALYQEELSIDETIRRGLSIDPRMFKSSRAEIMKNIDKNKYGTSPMKKLINHLKKYRGAYTSIAAVVAAAIFITPYLSKTGIAFGAKKSAMPKSASMDKAPSLAQSASEGLRSTAESKSAAPKIQTKNEETADNTLSVKNADAYIPRFGKKQLDKNYKPTFNTPWQTSLSKFYSATLEGRGDSAQDEGVAVIVVNQTSTGQQWSFSLLDNDMQQISPRSIYWVDDENLLVVVGLAQGHASLGGNLYMLNINTCKTRNVDPENRANLQNGSVIVRVASTKVLPSKQLEITVEVAVYDDDIKNRYHVENRTIVIPYPE